MPTEAQEAGPMTRGRLDDKVAIVTGAASGIGRATAERFVREGARVIVADISGELAEATSDQLGPNTAPVEIDVCDAAAVNAMVEEAVRRFGQVDILHNNAGIAEAVKPLAEIGRAEWDKILEVNLTAFFLCAQAVVPVMREAGGGSIIVTASIAARRPRPGMAAYVASKSGAIGLAKALAIELAPDQIRVNIINPGPARTPMIKEFGFSGDEEEAVRQLASNLPLGRAVDPADIAAAAVYLASDESAKVTGLVMNVDSGRDL
jgi:3-oxoacyl-[acyl-carrier protein] reductase